MNEIKDRRKQDYKNYYDVLEVIGNGAFGCVYKGKEKNTNEYRALKVMSLKKIKENLLNQYEVEDIENQLNLCIQGFIQEFENMKICSEDNNYSVKCYEYFYNNDNFILVMELCDMNLSELLAEKILKDKKCFNINEIMEIMKQINFTFKIMKENKIIHRDLKLENILIKCINKKNSNYIVKISDYGSSKKLLSLSKNCNSNVGTISYNAPEIMNRKEYNYKCDLWSIGIILYKLFFGKSPFLGQTEEALIKNINNFGNTLLKKSGDKNLDDLLKRLLEKDPIKRLDWDSYLNHPFFNSEFQKNINIKINLIYDVEEENIENIFGLDFVINNKNNIELIINGEKSELVEEYRLKKGENIIQMIIKKKNN